MEVYLIQSAVFTFYLVFTETFMCMNLAFVLESIGVLLLITETSLLPLIYDITTEQDIY